MVWAGGFAAGGVAAAIEEEKRKREQQKKKEWECVKVNHHNDIGKVIEEREKNGWRLYAYQAQGSPTIVNHYLLFVREH